MSNQIESLRPRISAREAARLLGVGTTVFHHWEKHGCPHLPVGEELIVHRPACSRKGVRYDLKQMEDIKTARSRASSIPLSRRKYLSYQEVKRYFAKHFRKMNQSLQRRKPRKRKPGKGRPQQAHPKRNFGFSQHLLYDWHEKGCCYLNDEPLKARQEWRIVGNNVREIWVYNRKQLKTIAGRMRRELSGIFEEKDGTWLSAKAAYEIYGIWAAALGEWRKYICPILRRKIHHRPQRRLNKQNGRETRYVYLEKDLQEVAKALAVPPSGVYEDQEGRWLFAFEVAKRTGWPVDGLWYYRNKHWNCLSTGKIRSKDVPSRHHPRMNGLKTQRDREVVHVCREEDIDHVAAYRRGETREILQQEATQATPVLSSAADGTGTQDKKRPGRPTGAIDPDIKERNEKMVAAWKEGKFTSAAEAGRAFEIEDRSYARKILIAAGCIVGKKPRPTPPASPAN